MDTFTNFNTPIPAIDLDRDKEFHILVSSVKEYAIFMIDPEGLIKTWNDGAKISRDMRLMRSLENIFQFFIQKTISKKEQLPKTWKWQKHRDHLKMKAGA
jgi:hypothetical protein